MTQQAAIAGGAVTFSELVGVPALSRTITANRRTRTETRVGLIAWINIDALLLECFPAAPALPGVHPSVAYMYVQEIEIKPWPPVPAESDLSCLSTNVNYTSAICTIKYAPLEYDDGDLIKRRARVSVDVMTLPANATKWEDTGERPEQEDLIAGKQIPMVDWQFSYFQVPPAKEAVLDAAVQALIGHVNDGVYDGKASETLLFKGYDKEWAVDSNGDQKFTYGYQFGERRVQDGSSVYGWNHFYRNKTGTWAKLLQKDGSPIYPKSANFSNLFV